MMKNISQHLRDSLFCWFSTSNKPDWASLRYSGLDLSEGLNTVTDPVRWLTPERSKDALIEVATAWHCAQPGRTGTGPTCAPQWSDDLSEIQGEVWCGLQRIQPMPDIAVLSESIDEQILTPLGILSGFANYAAKHFFISHIALHPALHPTRADRLWYNDAGRQVYASLVDAAIDLSQQMECHGWVACSPPAAHEAAWQSLKFYRHDNMTLRRMGYFTS